MPRNFFTGLLALCVTLFALPLNAAEQANGLSGDFKREEPTRFDSDLYSVEKKLLRADDGNNQFEYRLIFRARRDMKNVLLVESLPEGVTLIKATPEPDRSYGNEFFWKVEGLPAGVERTVDLSVKTATVGTFITRSWVSADTGVSLPIVSDSMGGLELTKTCPEYVEPNTTIPFLITVKNTGMRIAKNVQVLEIPPLTLSMGNFNPNIGDLKPGESREIALTGSTVVKGKHVNLARAFTEGVAIPVEARATVIVADPPQVNFVKRGGGTFYVSQPVTYQILVRNDGEMPMRDIVVTDAIPPGVQVFSTSDSPKVTWPTKDQAGSISWAIEQLGAGQAKVIEFSLLATTPVQVSAVARVEGTAPTGKRYGAESMTETVWKGVPGVLSILFDTKDPIQVGEETVYKVQVINQGEHETIKARLIFRLSDHLKPLYVKGISGEDISGQAVTFSALTLKPGESCTFDISAQGVVKGVGKATLELKADFMAEPVIKEESTLVY